ncbi:MAG: SDR family oxidoreductase [Myxococcales bacterium]|nr:SDR family oxidoreductase [Myxococcales bacterium]MCB9537822.1 SDR family oxidoreductase [Myxococcales bacterium]
MTLDQQTGARSSPRRVLVTGGAGFIGSHLVRALLARGDEVVVIDNFETGQRANLAEVADRIRLVEGSIADAAAVADALEGVDAVLHEAALPSVPKSLERPVDTHRANVVGTLTLLEGCRRMGVQRFVYAASSSAYGDHAAESKSEDLEPRPKSPYAVQKLAGEYYCRVFHALYGLQTVALRYFNVFGARQNPKSQYAAVVPAFVTRMLAGRPPIVHGDGLQSRDFTYIDNVIEANLAALRAPSSACGRVYNAACGDSITLLRLVASINEILGTSIEPQHVEARAGDVRHSRADVSAAAEALGFRAAVSVDDGLRETVAWYAARVEDFQK